MHIPDGFLSTGVATTTWIVAGGSLAMALRAERHDPVPMPSGILGSVAAFLFAAQMVNVPVAPGTSGHLVGAMLATVLLGPWRAMLAMAAVLAVQALLFQDGGITAFGANFIDMGAAGCLTGYAVAHMASRRIRGPRGVAAGAIVGGFAATVCGAALVAVWLSASGLYPLRGILPIMLVTHVAIGLLEAALTGAILVALLRWRPDLAIGIGGSESSGNRPVALGLGLFGAALLAAAFVAPFASSLPDGLDKAAQTLGFAGRARPLWRAPMPEYALPWSRLALVAPAIAGIVGTLAVAALAWAISRSLANRDDASHR
jgi:cobalt/nickel transport system permease protein